jgi:uncharacterized C2H2 Zn-finger protein
MTRIMCPKCGKTSEYPKADSVDNADSFTLGYDGTGCFGHELACPKCGTVFRYSVHFVIECTLVECEMGTYELTTSGKLFAGDGCCEKFVSKGSKSAKKACRRCAQCS